VAGFLARLILSENPAGAGGGGHCSPEFVGCGGLLTGQPAHLGRQEWWSHRRGRPRRTATPSAGSAPSGPSALTGCWSTMGRICGRCCGPAPATTTGTGCAYRSWSSGPAGPVPARGGDGSWAGYLAPV